MGFIIWKYRKLLRLNNYFKVLVSAWTCIASSYDNQLTPRCFIIEYDYMYCICFIKAKITKGIPTLICIFDKNQNDWKKRGNESDYPPLVNKAIIGWIFHTIKNDKKKYYKKKLIKKKLIANIEREILGLMRKLVTN